MWLIIPILIMLISLIFAWKKTGQKMRKYILISNGIGIGIIFAVMLISEVDGIIERTDSERYDITQGAVLSAVEYMREEDGYYVISESGLFYTDYLAIPVEGVEMSGICYPGAAVKLYRGLNAPVVYDDESRVELSDGSYAYYVDNVIAIKFDFDMFAIWMMFPVVLFLFANSIVCLIIALVVAVHKKRQKEENS